jgi:hypothetical protein
VKTRVMRARVELKRRFEAMRVSRLRDSKIKGEVR